MCRNDKPQFEFRVRSGLDKNRLVRVRESLCFSLKCNIDV